jgi:hypothetical protein
MAMRPYRNGLLAALLLAFAPLTALAQQDPAPAPAPPPPAMDDPGQPATAESIKPDDPRLAPLPDESAPASPDRKPAPQKHEKSDGDPTNLPAIPTDDAFHPPPKNLQETQTADGYSVRSYTEPNGDHVEEYRHGGQLTTVKVQPAHGPAFELHDTDGPGQNNNDVTSSQVNAVQWKLFEWH